MSDSSGKLKDNYEVFLKTIDALGKVKNETERDALAMDIFGRSATDLNPLIEAGSGRLKELAEQAHEVGYVVDNETLQSFGELDDAMQKLDKQGDAVKRSFAEALLPVITAFAEALNAIPTPVLTAVISITSIATVVLLVVKAIKELQGPAGTVKSMIGSVMSYMDPLYIKNHADRCRHYCAGSGYCCPDRQRKRNQQRHERHILGYNGEQCAQPTARCRIMPPARAARAADWLLWVRTGRSWLHCAAENASTTAARHAACWAAMLSISGASPLMPRM